MIVNTHMSAKGWAASACLSVAAFAAGSPASVRTARRMAAKAAAYGAVRPVIDQRLIPNNGVRGPNAWRKPVRT